MVMLGMLTIDPYANIQSETEVTQMNMTLEEHGMMFIKMPDEVARMVIILFDEIDYKLNQYRDWTGIEASVSENPSMGYKNIYEETRKRKEENYRVQVQAFEEFYLPVKDNKEVLSIHPFNEAIMAEVTEWVLREIRRISYEKFGEDVNISKNSETHQHTVVINNYPADWMKALDAEVGRSRYKELGLISGTMTTGPLEVYYKGEWHTVIVPKGYMLLHTGICAELITRKKVVANPHGVKLLYKTKTSMTFIDEPRKSMELVFNDKRNKKVRMFTYEEYKKLQNAALHEDPMTEEDRYMYMNYIEPVARIPF